MDACYKTVNICSKLITPPSDEGGVFCKAKDGGRERNCSLPQSAYSADSPLVTPARRRAYKAQPPQSGGS